MNIFKSNTGILRVYEPLEAFNKLDQYYWKTYIDLEDVKKINREREDFVRILRKELNLSENTPIEHCDYKLIRNKYFIFPYYVQLEIETKLPDVLSSLPLAFKKGVERKIKIGRVQQSLLCPYHRNIKLHAVYGKSNEPSIWFFLFSNAEKESTFDKIYKREKEVYWSTISNALGRGERAIKALVGKSKLDVKLIEFLNEIRNFLMDFSSESYVELNYSSMASIYSAYKLANSLQPDEIWELIELVDKGIISCIHNSFMDVIFTKCW